MKFTGEFTVPAPRTQVFEKLNDPQFFAYCLEGVSDLEEIDPEHYKAVRRSPFSSFASRLPFRWSRGSRG